MEFAPEGARPLLDGLTAAGRRASRAADATLAVDGTDFRALTNNPQAGMQLYFSGELSVEGDAGLAMKLQLLFGQPQKGDGHCRTC
jgi:ubiquinone biosynthesis protein UbiJ